MPSKIDPTLKLTLLPGQFIICQDSAGTKLPDSIYNLPFFSVTRTNEEISLVYRDTDLPNGVEFEWEKVEKGWKAFQVLGPLGFGLVGILAGISGVLAEAGVSVFAISTYNTDYILVKQEQIVMTIRELSEAGYRWVE
jgi:hypothetical protein